MTTTVLNLVAKESFTLQLKFLSDWHIGSGAGRPGDVDRLVQRDRHNLPYIPAKSLTGIWRDACERVAYGLDNGQPDGDWQKWVTYLFGDQPALRGPDDQTEYEPLPAALSVKPAHFSPDLQAALIPKPRLHNLICIIKPGIKIEADTGCAEPDCLRLEEQVRGGAVLTATCELRLPTDKLAQQIAYALLIAGTQFVERIGGKRRRGAGRCRCLIQNEPVNAWIDCIAKNPQPPTPPLNRELYKHPVTTPTPEANSSSANTWDCFDLTIEATSPLVMATRTIGNVVESLDYIPGTHLLRLMLNRLRDANLLKPEEVHRAIAQKDIVITPATIEIDGNPGRPVPLCWLADKQAGGLRKGGTIYNSFIEPERDDLQLKGEREYYIGKLTNASDAPILPNWAVVKKGIATHNVVDDRVQRPTEEVGGVFSYEAIAPNTRFRAQLRLRHTLAHQIKQSYRDQQTREPKSSDWWTGLDGHGRLGVSKKDDYGAVTFSVSEAPRPDSPKTSSELYVWMLSDTLIRDQRLRYSTQIDDLQRELSNALGAKITVDKARQQTSRTESWQRSWGLPRPSLVGIQAGSCFVFKCDQEIPGERLQQLQIEGIGDRTAEGYGQVCFNDPLVMNTTSKMEPPESSNSESSNSEPPAPLLNEQSDGFDYARIIEREAWRDMIRRRSLELAAQPAKRKDYLGLESSNPPNTQLGALNSQLRQLRSVGESDQQIMLHWINKIRETPNRHEKWQIKDRSPALEKIQSLVSDKSQIWQILELETDEITLTVSGDEQLKQQLWAEAVRVFVDACIRAHRRDQEQQEQAQEEPEQHESVQLTV